MNDRFDVSTESSDVEPGLSRRKLLIRGAQGAMLVGIGASLIACNADGSPKSGSQTEGKPRRGGTLRVGMLSAGNSDTLNPSANQGTYLSMITAYQLYDQLFAPGSKVNEVVPGLATSAEVSNGGATWTLKLRDGVVWHDGSPFTAADVVYTMKTWQDAEFNFSSGFVADIIDFAGVRSTGPLEVVVPLTRAVAEFPSLLTIWNFFILKDGTKANSFNTAPVGTGPFKFESFQAGKQATFIANKDYWEEGKPYVDRVVLNSSFTDENARLNALLSGKIDVAPILPYESAAAQKQAGRITILTAPSANFFNLSMRIDKAPYTDKRVRQALALAADREAIVKGSLSGYGTVGNDLIGVGAKYFDDSYVVKQDVDKAKSLLKAAGYSDLKVQLKSSNAVPGLASSATLFKQQVKAAGIDVELELQDPSVYFTTAGGYLTRPFSASYGLPYPSLTFIYRAYFDKGAPYNHTHWPAEKSADLLGRAIAETNEERAAQMWHDVQKQQIDEGGTIVWGNADSVDGVGKNVKGIVAGAWPLNTFRLLDGWIES